MFYPGHSIFSVLTTIMAGTKIKCYVVGGTVYSQIVGVMYMFFFSP